MTALQAIVSPGKLTLSPKPTGKIEISYHSNSGKWKIIHSNYELGIEKDYLGFIMQEVGGDGTNYFLYFLPGRISSKYEKLSLAQAAERAISRIEEILLVKRIDSLTKTNGNFWQIHYRNSY